MICFSFLLLIITYIVFCCCCQFISEHGISLTNSSLKIEYFLIFILFQAFFLSSPRKTKRIVRLLTVSVTIYFHCIFFYAMETNSVWDSQIYPTSSSAFHTRKKVIWFWNNMRVSILDDNRIYIQVNFSFLMSKSK